MKTVNVLLLGMGGNVSQGILKAIRLSKLKCNIVGACISEDSPGLYMCDKAYISPYANSEEFIPWLNNLCNLEKIDIILTGVEEIIFSIAKNISEIENKTSAKFISSSLDKLAIGRDKLKTCEWLRENGFEYPDFAESKDYRNVLKLYEKHGFPLIGKPRDGKGSRGVVIIDNEEKLKFVSNLENYVIQEYIGNPNEEYTVGCYCSKLGELIEIIIMHRILKDGTTSKAIVIENKDIYVYAKGICEAFKPKGPLNIQLRIDKCGKPVCFELNVRFSGTTPIRSNFGYNDVIAQIYEYVLEEDIYGLFDIKKGTAYRYLEEIYIPENSEFKLNRIIANKNK